MLAKLRSRPSRATVLAAAVLGSLALAPAAQSARHFLFEDDPERCAHEVVAFLDEADL